MLKHLLLISHYLHIENLGELLTGNKIENSLYKANMKEMKTCWVTIIQNNLYPPFLFVNYELLNLQ
jgi:hypothetical protein